MCILANWRNKIKKNTPKVELHSIMSLVVGGYKTGKTRLWKEVTELHYANPEEALLIAFEPGYETWELENIIPIHEEAITEDETWKVWEAFKKEVVPGLIKEAKENRVVKLIGIDTADRCIDAATAWIIKDRNKKYAKSFSSLQEISKDTDENGWTILLEEMKKQFDALRAVGYGIMGLAWTKEKEITLYDGKKYNTVELMMHSTGRKVFESQASLICCLFSEVKILDKDGKELEENLKNKKGKEIGTKFHETEVYMYFRPSQYISIAGGRYTNLPEKVIYSAENFMEVFEEAVKGQLKKTNKTVEELKLEEQEQKDAKIKEIVQEEEKQPELTLDELVAKIKETAVEKNKSGIDINNIKAIIGSLKYDNVEEAKGVLTKVEALK